MLLYYNVILYFLRSKLLKIQLYIAKNAKVIYNTNIKDGEQIWIHIFLIFMMKQSILTTY